MKRRLFILFLFPFLLCGQNKAIDSLKFALKNAKHDTTRCIVLAELTRKFDDKDILIYAEPCVKLAEKNIAIGGSHKKVYSKSLAIALRSIGYLALRQGDNVKALEYYNKCLKLNESVGDEEGMAASMSSIGLIYFYNGDMAMVIEYWNKSLKIYERLGNKIKISDFLNDLGAVSRAQGKLPEAMKYYEKSLKMREKIGDKNAIATSLSNIAGIYQAQGDISKALDYNHQCLRMKEEIGVDKRGIAESLSNIAVIYDGQNETLKAIEYNQKSLTIKEEIGDELGIAASLINFGTFYLNSNLEKALDYFKKGLKVYEKLQNKQGIADAMSNIADICNKQGAVPMALEYYHKSLKMNEEIGNKIGIASSCVNIGIIFWAKDKIKEAFNFSNRGLIVSREAGNPYLIGSAAGALKSIYLKQNKYKEAFEMYELEIKMRDSINNQETQKAAVKKQMQYTYDKKAALDSAAHAKENEINNAEINTKKAEIKVKQNTQYALYGGLALVLVFAGFMFNRFKVTQKQKHIIEIKEKETQQQKHIIEEKHKEITDSINYAERIQRSFIATKEILDENLSDYFVFFKPKDVVSGDFYWASKLVTSSGPNGYRDEKFALVTADSTGHGVPGAIMSLLNITSLEKAIETLTEPSEILNSTRKTIIERLKKDGSEHGGKDGMDASLTVYDFKNKKLIVAAANNPVWIVRKKTATEALVIEIKPDKMPVGKHDRDTVSFTQQEIDLHTGDVVYTLTDGFPDQFGGEKGKKFMSKNLRELLTANSHLPMHEQKLLLEKTFAAWVGNLEQVDDVTIIGVRV